MRFFLKIMYEDYELPPSNAKQIALHIYMPL